MRDQVRGTEREGDPDQIAMVADDGVNLIAGERQHDRDLPARSPPPSSRELPSHALIPSDLTLESTQVIESGLDFDDEKRASPAVEGEKIYPAVRPPVDDLDLASRLPAQVSETSIDVGGAPSVDGVTNAGTSREEGAIRDQLDLETESVCDSLDHPQVRGDRACLELRDVRA